MKVPWDAELEKRRANDESYRERLEGLRTDLRIVQSPLGVKKGELRNALNSKNYGSCEAVKLTRSVPGIRANERAGEKRGRNC